jgi:aryl-alcohol dehydrogenase-like predicted oxidoreductase
VHLNPAEPAPGATIIVLENKRKSPAAASKRFGGLPKTLAKASRRWHPVHAMKSRYFSGTDLQVSEVGFGLWTVSTGWWGNYTNEEAIALMQEAFDLGITLFDAADTYGNGRSEELIAQAFRGKRDKIVIATKVGYDFVHHGEERRGQREIPQNFRPEAIRSATDAALGRLATDHIDVLQLHNLRMEQVDDDALWETLEELRAEGKVKEYGVALGPAIGWLGEGVRTIRKRKPAVVQHIYNLLEQHPGKAIQDAALNCDAKTGFLIRVPHSSGLLEGKYTAETVFPPGDHRSHRPRSWLLNGVKKVEQLRFLERGGVRTLGQAAILWLLADDRVASVLPNIYDSAQLREFAETSDKPGLSAEEIERIANLVSANFGLEPEEPKYKGTMKLSEELAAV